MQPGGKQPVNFRIKKWLVEKTSHNVILTITKGGHRESDKQFV